jgi:hypothetical protein
MKLFCVLSGSIFISSARYGDQIDIMKFYSAPPLIQHTATNTCQLKYFLMFCCQLKCEVPSWMLKVRHVEVTDLSTAPVLKFRVGAVAF